MVGIDHVDVNIIGRYAVVKHCSVACCAPVSKIVDTLNSQMLGASVAEANADDELDNKADQLNLIKLTHVAVVGLLFVAGVIAQRILGDSVPSLVLFLVSTGLGLLPVLQEAFVSIRRFSLDIHILMVVAVVGAIIDEEYLDASLLMSLFIAAEMIEEVVMQRVRKAIKVSSGSVPKKATLVSGKSVMIEALRIGDVIAVRAGEMIQADGKISRGDGVVDESALTGEAAPVSKKKGDRASSGTVVQNGYIEITIDTAVENSTMRKLNQAVLDVQADKGAYGRIVDRVALYWTPGVLITAILIAVIGGSVTKEWNKYLLKVNVYCSCLDWFVICLTRRW